MVSLIYLIFNEDMWLVNCGGALAPNVFKSLTNQEPPYNVYLDELVGQDFTEYSLYIC